MPLTIAAAQAERSGHDAGIPQTRRHSGHMRRCGINDAVFRPYAANLHHPAHVPSLRHKAV
ncbi:hypothetical protein [Paenibacillus chitinolyticus]